MDPRAAAPAAPERSSPDRAQPGPPPPVVDPRSPAPQLPTRPFQDPPPPTGAPRTAVQPSPVHPLPDAPPPPAHPPAFPTGSTPDPAEVAPTAPVPDLTEVAPAPVEAAPNRQAPAPTAPTPTEAPLDPIEAVPNGQLPPLAVAAPPLTDPLPAAAAPPSTDPLPAVPAPPSTDPALTDPPLTDYVGSGPPTYDAEPSALPLADPDGLDELVPDTVLDGARIGAGTLRAASVRGDSARFRGEPRRDCLLTARFGTGEQALVLVAMATGARGTPGAHRAAAQVCHWIGRAVGRSHLRLVEDIRAARRGELKSGLHRLTDRGFGRLRASAEELGADPEEYTADLRCLLLPGDPSCRTRVFFGVGEGGLFRLRDGEWQDIEPRFAGTAGEAVAGFGSPPSETPEGDRVTLDLGVTTPPDLPDPAEPPRDPFRFRASVARPGDTLLLCTSGLADPLRGEPQLAEHLTLRWSRGGPPGLDAFLADTRVRVKGYADDRTAAAVWEA
ncbi:protein phosphatase 2C domain-containing protein [Streptomyces sp. NPDC052040]|uniref:protein phosphatase 2C domain-containing protein n=1 Tax=Streptomyces sp. NPDC052040 TaxID=3365682 RepID=UPI0037D8103D